MELVANRSVVEHELRRALASRRANQKNSVLLLRAAPEWRGELEFSFEDKDRQIAVTVAPCATVLAVLDALAGPARRSVPGRPHPLRHPRGRGLRSRPGAASGDQAG